MAHKLFIGGLSVSKSSEHLRDLSTQAGTVAWITDDHARVLSSRLGSDWIDEVAARAG